MKIDAKRWLVPALLTWVAVIGLWQSYRHTLTSDEAIHTASAYLAITRADHRFDPEHPFLFKYLTALPVFLYTPNPPTIDRELWDKAEPTLYDSWVESRIWADQWVYESGNDAKTMQVLMRLPGIATLVFLCWFVWWLTRRWFTVKAANWALFLTAFTPTLLAHGPLTNTDVPLALTFLIAVWRFGEYGKSPTYRNALWVGVALAAALLTKYSALGLLPAAVLWLAGIAVVRKVRFVHMLGHGATALAVIVFLIWTTYLFQSPVVVTDAELTMARDQLFGLLGRRAPALGNWLEVFPHLLPSAYLKGLVMTIGWSLNGRASYILGEMYSSGVWFYFPVLYILKSQLVYVLLSLAALLTALRYSFDYKKMKVFGAAMLVCGGIFLALAVKSKLNLGIRHIAPIFPLINIGLGIWLALYLPKLKMKALPTIIALCIAVPTIFQSPNLLAFGNSLTVPANERYRYFGDSNLDWGQSWERVADVLEREFPGQPVYLKHYLSPLKYYAPNNPQFDIKRAGTYGEGAILINASDLLGEHETYDKYEPAFTVDNVYYIHKTKLVPK